MPQCENLVTFSDSSLNLQSYHHNTEELSNFTTWLETLIRPTICP